MCDFCVEVSSIHHNIVGYTFVNLNIYV